MKPTLMIHEFKKEYLELPLEEYILTFDDGLYTQYLFLDELRKLNTIKIFSISTGIVCDGEQSDSFIKCGDAHEKAFHGNFENYMKWEQIREINQYTNCFIAGHSHFHKNLSKIKPLNEQIKFIKKDTNLMLNCFKTNLEFRPSIFCLPSNVDFMIYRILLEQHYKFKTILGPERIDIEDLLKENK